MALTILLFLGTQTGAFLWWGAKLTEKVRGHGERIERLERHQDSSEGPKP
jgi:hypothetical protein